MKSSIPQNLYTDHRWLLVSKLIFFIFSDDGVDFHWSNLSFYNIAQVLIRIDEFNNVNLNQLLYMMQEAINFLFFVSEMQNNPQR